MAELGLEQGGDAGSRGDLELVGVTADQLGRMSGGRERERDQQAELAVAEHGDRLLLVN